MTFKEYVDGMQRAIDDNPKIGEMTAVYSADDEGNAFYEVYDDIPTVGIFDGDYGGDFISEDDNEAIIERIEEGEEINAVCIN